HDPLVGLGQRLLATAFFFHPLVHVANRVLARTREEICDNHAVARSSSELYARTLLNLAAATREGITLRLPMTFAHLDLRSRIKGLLNQRRSIMTTTKSRIALPIGIALVGLGLSTAFLTSPLRASEKAEQPRPDTGRWQVLTIDPP